MRKTDRPHLSRFLFLLAGVVLIYGLFDGAYKGAGHVEANEFAANKRDPATIPIATVFYSANL